jgi:nucleoside-diphosphate-sugar epimerase
VYGSRQDPRSPYANVIPVFIGRIARNLPPVIFDDGEQSRDFVYIDDVVRANILATGKGIEGVYNIGSGKATTINELVNIILILMQKDLKPIHEKPRAGDPRHTRAEITRAACFGYKPECSLEEGLKAVIPAYSSQTNLE